MELAGLLCNVAKQVLLCPMQMLDALLESEKRANPTSEALARKAQTIYCNACAKDGVASFRALKREAPSKTIKSLRPHSYS